MIYLVFFTHSRRVLVLFSQQKALGAHLAFSTETEFRSTVYSLRAILGSGKRRPKCYEVFLCESAFRNNATDFIPFDNLNTPSKLRVQNLD